MKRAESGDPFRGGLTWEQMEEANHGRLREVMKLSPGERIERAIRVSRLATELAAAPVVPPRGRRERDTTAGG